MLRQMYIADRKEYMILMIMFFSCYVTVGSAPPLVYFSDCVHSLAKANAPANPTFPPSGVPHPYGRHTTSGTLCFKSEVHRRGVNKPPDLGAAPPLTGNPNSKVAH